RCHPGTQAILLRQVDDRLRDHEEWDLMWISGPADSGKTTVARTITQTCLDNGRLGTAIFITHPIEFGYARRVLPTVAYQLACKNAPYASEVGAALAANSNLVQDDVKAQYKHLINDPFATLRKRGDPWAQKPLVVVVDGLFEGADNDHCDAELRTFFQCICASTRGAVGDSPLIWVISGRVYLNLAATFTSHGSVDKCLKVGLALDNSDKNRVSEVSKYLSD
ncbi:hypothetical protein P691DRAFT_641229, partial [Macrolepiota fuliginosa MF-IS2]